MKPEQMYKLLPPRVKACFIDATETLRSWCNPVSQEVLVFFTGDAMEQTGSRHHMELPPTVRGNKYVVVL